ncbi:MAG TPA: hypothetical protein IAC37_07835 [Candidatus Ventrimonas merdavium]|nr:hypothetical protein [Candidatus Ventrimonas merdavium]
MGRSRRRRHARIRRAWRRLSVRQAAKQAGIRGGGLKTLLAGALALELAVGVRQAWQEQGMALSLIRQEETCRVELVRQLDGSGTEPGNGPGDRDAGEIRESAGTREIYGIRLDPKTLEIQMYHYLQEAGPVGENDQNEGK